MIAHEATLIDAASVLEKHQDWVLAQNVYRHLLRHDIQHIKAYGGLARTFASQGQHAGAVRILTSALSVLTHPTQRDSIRQDLRNSYRSWLDDPTLTTLQKFDVALESIRSHAATEKSIRLVIRYAGSLKRHVEAAQTLQVAQADFSGLSLEILHARATLAYIGEDKRLARVLLFELLQASPLHEGGLRLFAALCAQHLS